ncbi:hypothetical protein DPMN_162776 [Dreissena polymorpha]|uniref:Uncharacterized protein n=1 Tax=Dreissena polymorpha TaxID=45954 RepID=A0A9D4IQU2_DREPO|nr:hypothetical protein DPMN_162776 [Dreissena polymorpha]
MQSPEPHVDALPKIIIPVTTPDPQGPVCTNTEAKPNKHSGNTDCPGRGTFYYGPTRHRHGVSRVNTESTRTIPDFNDNDAEKHGSDTEQSRLPRRDNNLYKIKLISDDFKQIANA